MVINGEGNRLVFQKPRKEIHRSVRVPAAEIQERVAFFTKAAARGAVLVSPSISPGEKAVMRAAFEQGFPLIYLQENGFTDLAKPDGKRMEACARGQLLILAPWEHHNEKKPISRQQCQLLNYLTIELCSHPTDNNSGSPAALKKQ